MQVWAVNLALYSLHIGGSSRVGEPWSSPESWVQLAGFVLLLAGTIIYAQVPVQSASTCSWCSRPALCCCWRGLSFLRTCLSTLLCTCLL